jgi:hypothetical protein
MIRIITVAVLSVSFFLVMISGCAYDNKEELYPPKPADTTTVSYAVTIKPMLQTNCASSGCHESGGQMPDLTIYQNVFDNRTEIDRRAAQTNASDPMPSAGQMSASDRDKLGRWIDQGAHNN